MRLWNDYGIVSYNMGNDAEYMKLTYYNLLLALEETTPELVIVDAFNVFSEEDNLSFAAIHRTLDAYPLSYKKYLTIKELTDEREILDNTIEYLFNFSMYHARWDELSKEDFELVYTYEKGAETKINITSKNRIDNFSLIPIYNKEENINMQYLRKIIECCIYRNIDILVTFLPCSAWDTSVSVSKYVQNITNDYDVNYINFLDMNMIDYEIDFFDIYGHLNVSGARKITDYIEKYIMDNYNIPDQRNNENYDFWNEDYNKYIDFKISNLVANEKNLNNYLMLLYGEEDISYEIKISSKQEIKESTTLQRLLVNIGNNYEIFSTAVTYASGLLINRVNKIEDKKKSTRWKRICVELSFIINLSILFLFKYFDFAIDNINKVLGHLNMQLLNPSFDVVLPVGISFYIFQALSYTVDVYREDVKAEKNFLRYALFVSFFPQLVAGPIERSKKLLEQMYEKHYFDGQRVKDGLLLMIWGGFQKIVIADRVAIVVDTVFNNYPQYGGMYIVVAAILFAFQIYCDFSGYSIIAMGAAKVMGFRLMENFNCPYFSKSVAEFWRRWHISLSTWFRDYLYIPLGGNRKGNLRKYINLMIVFIVSGLWHGASWSFIVWGALNRNIPNYRRKIKEYKRLVSTKVAFKQRNCKSYNI